MQFLRFAPLALAASVSAETLANVLSANNDTLSTLNGVLAMVPDVSKMLMSTNNLTILAPSNDAFNKLFQEMPMAKEMVNNKTFVTMLLQYHVMSGMMMSTDFMETPKFVPTMLSMSPMMASASSSSEAMPMSGMPMSGMPMSGMPMKKRQNMMPMGGMAPAAESMPMGGMAPAAASETMGMGMQMVELQMMNKMAMIFSGFKQMSTVSKADIKYDMGVVHVIDKVLTMPGSPSQTALDMGYTSFAGALAKTKMAMSVDGLSDATIFVPNNKAFEAVGSMVEAASSQDLMSVLSYHVLHGGDSAMFSTMLEGMTSSGMMSGSSSSSMSMPMSGSSSGEAMPMPMPAPAGEGMAGGMMPPMMASSMPKASGAAGMMPMEGGANMPAAAGEGMAGGMMPPMMASSMPKASAAAAGGMMPMAGGSMPSMTGGAKGMSMPMATGMPMAMMPGMKKRQSMNMPMPMAGGENMNMPMPMAGGENMNMPMSSNMPMASNGKVMMMMLETLAGGNLTVRTENNELFVNSAMVVTADIITNNGVMHVLDNVLNPMDTEAMPNPSATTQAPAFANATPVQEAPFTENVKPSTTLMAGAAAATSMNSANGRLAGAMPNAALLVGGAVAVFAQM